MSSGSGEDKAKSRAAKRRNAALEVFFTERSYGKHLTDLSKYYHEPLKLQDAGAASAIFSNFEALKQLNMSVLFTFLFLIQILEVALHSKFTAGSWSTNSRMSSAKMAANGRKQHRSEVSC